MVVGSVQRLACKGLLHSRYQVWGLWMRNELKALIEHPVRPIVGLVAELLIFRPIHQGFSFFCVGVLAAIVLFGLKGQMLASEQMIGL